MSQLSYKEIIENQLPEDLYKSKDAESQAIGNSLDEIQNDVDSLEKEVNPLSAVSKGLEQWERFFKLPSNIEDSIEMRRARVIAELIQFMSDENVIRKDEMEEIISLYSNACKVIEHFADYVFDVNLKLTGESELSLNIDDIHKVIKKIKPTWLGYNLSLEFNLKNSNIYFASCLISGEEITVYPYSPRNIESKGSIFIATGNNTGLENITVYPRKEVI
ncbi:putative phage tail protein [Sporanaerobacter acetigenes]|uniref:putative phage tail protein n=1 Tax=Sporanaerobacter acetigenes TaxID=165813 RepID=UPI0033182299